jgi:hypothetical protein
MGIFGGQIKQVSPCRWLRVPGPRRPKGGQCFSKALEQYGGRIGIHTLGAFISPVGVASDLYDLSKDVSENGNPLHASLSLTGLGIEGGKSSSKFIYRSLFTSIEESRMSPFANAVLGGIEVGIDLSDMMDYYDNCMAGDD